MELLLELSQSRIEGAVSRFEVSVILTSVDAQVLRPMFCSYTRILYSGAYN
jgi:hypothetical protein